MPNETGNYADIRQIVVDAVTPIKDQIDRLYESLKTEFARKDVVDPKIDALERKMEKLEEQVLNTPQKLLLIIGGLLGIVSAIITILQHFHL